VLGFLLFARKKTPLLSTDDRLLAVERAALLHRHSSHGIELAANYTTRTDTDLCVHIDNKVAETILISVGRSKRGSATVLQCWARYLARYLARSLPSRLGYLQQAWEPPQSLEPLEPKPPFQVVL
jgi:hypothetical protein